MVFIFIADDEPDRTEISDLGGDITLASLSNRLRPVKKEEIPQLSVALAMHKDDHVDVAVQQNRTASVLRMVVIFGFLVIAANVAVMAEVDNVATRVALGGTSLLGVGLVYYLRSTLIPLNKDLLSRRDAIRVQAAEIEERERLITALAEKLRDDAGSLQALVRVIQQPRKASR